MLMLKKLFRSGFARQASVLASGTAVAHLLAIGTLPLITRLYTPEQFGVLGIFVAFMSIASVIANWRYEIAIPLPVSDVRAANLAAVALVCGFLSTGFSLLFIWFFGTWLAERTKFAEVADFMWLLPIGIFFSAAYAVFQYWATRRQSFKRIARTRIEQSVGCVGIQLVTGWLGSGTVGLIVGQIVNSGAGFLGLARHAWKEDRVLVSEIGYKEMISLAREYDRFPKFSVLESLLNISAVQLPLILIGLSSKGAEVGYLMLGMRLMQAPVGLIGASISQVFLVKAVEAHRVNTLHILLNNTLAALLKTGVGPLAFAGIIAPTLCGQVFGDNWVRAGELISWMTPWFIFQFLSQPVSMVLHVTSNQRHALLLQFFGFVIRIGAVFVPSVFAMSEWTSESYALSGALFYMLYLFVIILSGGLSWIDFRGVLRKSVPYICLWGFIAAGFMFLISGEFSFS